MRRIADWVGVVSAVLVLAGCTDYGTRTFGVQRGAQEQTRVASPPPLSLPPILIERAATADAPPAENGAALARGEAPVTGPARGTRSVRTPRSSGEGSLLDAAGPSAPGDIRERVDQDAQIGRADPAYADALLFAPVGPREPGQAPLIQRESRSWLDRFF